MNFLFLPVRRKIDKLYHLSKLGKILTSILNLLQSISYGICLVNDLEDCVSDRALMEQIIDLRHVDNNICSCQSFHNLVEISVVRIKSKIDVGEVSSKTQALGFFFLAWCDSMN
jgi:hypothetical protein